MMKDDEKADDEAPVDLPLNMLSTALADWRTVDQSTILHRELLLKMLDIKKLCFMVLDTKDVSTAQKDATLSTLTQVMD